VTGAAVPAGAAAAVDPGWVQTQFGSFGLTHGVIVLVGLAVCLWCGIAARREAARGARSFADGFAGVVLGWNLLAIAWWFLPANWDVGTSLPLHVCDLTNLLLPLAIWSRDRLLMSVSVLWGLGLGTQAFVTPTVAAAPGEMEYWLFWVGHLTIAAGCCVLCGSGFRPGWRDWRAVVGVSLAVLVVLMGINGVVGVNYGYVGDIKPESTTIIDFLGAWPLRVVWLFLIASAAQALVVALYPVLIRVLGVKAGVGSGVVGGDSR